MRRLILAILLMGCALGFSVAAPVERLSVRGTVKSAKGDVLPFATIVIDGSNLGTTSDENGTYSVFNLRPGKYTLKVSMVGFATVSRVVFVQPRETTEADFVLDEQALVLEGAEVFGVRNRQSEKMDVITRLPLKVNEQLQSISVVSDKLIADQGALTIADVSRNVPGTYTYATYGNTKESISSRGFRGIPVLKNGVRINSDFRGQGFITDMSGVESMQVMKGAAAVTQGVATDLGSPGGVVNIVTKTPKFVNSGLVSLRAGSWGQIRPTFDVQSVLDNRQTVAIRFNGAYERADSYRPVVGLEKMYLNPSVEWRPNDKTTVTLELDYLNDSRTPDVGTVNLSLTENKIYKIPNDRFLGFKSDRQQTHNTTFGLRFRRDISDKFYVRAALFGSDLSIEKSAASLAAFTTTDKAGATTIQKPLNFRKRSITRDDRFDNNRVMQLDFVGKDLITGPLKHTLQLGFDYSDYDVTTVAYNAKLVDTIDVYAPVSNKLRGGSSSLTEKSRVNAKSQRMGVMFQDVISYSSWLRMYFGGRYSSVQTFSPGAAVADRTNTFNPLVGVMVTPIKNVSLFASYTNSTAPSSATEVDSKGNQLGNSSITQLEAGIKTEWFDNRLRFNVTLYKINNKDMNLQVAMVNPATGLVEFTGYYAKGGNDERKGVEVDLSGRVLPNLEIVAGYSYIDARYREHTTFVRNSRPNNTPKHTANLWVNYYVASGLLKGLSAGAGVYYLSERPNNDWTVTSWHGIEPGVAPWYMKPYTTVNAQLGYAITKSLDVRLVASNLLNKEGYNAYRTVYINQIDPRSFAATVSYRF